jgi:hypothetical protein
MKRTAVKITRTPSGNSSRNKVVKKTLTRSRAKQDELDAKKREAINRKRDVRYRT